jgi:hypothetical protein
LKFSKKKALSSAAQDMFVAPVFESLLDAKPEGVLRLTLAGCAAATLCISSTGTRIKPSYKAWYIK